MAAQGDIALTQTAGVQNFVRVNTSSAVPADLRIGLIASTAGNVLLNVSNGSIVQANAQTAAQTLSAAQLQAVSQTLHLTGLDGANDNAMASVIAFDNQVNRNLNLYSTLLKFGTVTNGAFVLNSDATTIALYAPQAALSLGIPLGQVTTQQVQNYAASQYAAYGNLFAPGLWRELADQHAGHKLSGVGHAQRLRRGQQWRIRAQQHRRPELRGKCAVGRCLYGVQQLGQQRQRVAGAGS